MVATCLRVIKQILHDKRSISMIFVVPLVITTFLFLLLGDSDVHLSLATNSQNPSVVTLLKKDADVTVVDDSEGIDDSLKSGKYDAYIKYTDQGTELYFLEENSLYVNKVHDILKKTQEKLSPQSKVSTHYLYGSRLKTTFEKLTYALIAIVAFFLIFLISGIAFVREQVLGTLERILISPVSKLRLILGYTLGFSIFGIVQGTLLLLFSRFVLNVNFKGSFPLMEMTIVLLSICAVSIGMFVAIFANTEFQMVQFIPLVIVPQILYSGIIAIRTLPLHLEKLQFLMPIYYGAQALKKVMVNGFTVTNIVQDWLALSVISLLFTLLNTFFLKKYRAL
ncbi:ABC transporter permease [Streptococcus gallolyticus]|uniref:ABC transporter permease n=1 Tax=Streptococcus gallolyticus TaxID=315405 RepID=UPI002283D219|nr:ABC transporter permease [Streptococcus gallolyticus]